MYRSPVNVLVAITCVLLARSPHLIASDVAELCKDATSIEAQQFAGVVLITAKGNHPRTGYQMCLVELPLDVYPPQFALMHVAPQIGGTAVTPFIVMATFRADEAVKEVTVITGAGPKVVEVKQVAKADDRAATNIKGALEDAGNFKTLLKLFKAAELEHEITVLRWCITVSAPTDEAFAKLPSDTLTKLLDPANKELLREVLHYHMIGRAMTRDEVFHWRSVESLSGQVFVRPGKGLFLGKSQPDFIDTDIRVECSVIIPMNAVLLK